MAENNGSSIGARHFIQKTLPSLGLSASFAVLGEPTDLGLYYGHDGWVSLEVRLEAASLESVQKAGNALFSFLSKGTGAAAAVPVEEMATGEPQLEKTSGGHRALVRHDRRLRTADEVVHLLRQVRKIAKLVSEPFCLSALSVAVARKPVRLESGKELQVKMLSYPWMTDPLNALFEEARLSMRAANCAVKGGTWTLPRLGMGTAGCALTRSLGIPAVGYGPGSPQTAHDPDEYVEIDNVNEAFFGTAVIAHRIIGAAAAGWSEEKLDGPQSAKGPGR